MKHFLSRFARGSGRGSGILESCFGALEVRALEALWNRADASVRTLQGDFSGTAYTTLMTTLDRLHKKGVLERRKEGRAFVYRQRYARAELESLLTRDALDGLLAAPADGALARPVLSGLVDAISGGDALLLDELERIVREKRAEAARTRSRGRDDR
jgi:predicted transcriptional regulator